MYFNGCKVRLLYGKEKRCKNFMNCPSYLECLEMVVITYRAVGWERIE
ncbi:MAG: hypothetical protein N2745_08450 [Syntrophorhabdaceae bacterium]|nr:hypothetical protein [Syntrophorhabdaceae bacterium]